jgi:aldehyde dehydrogenase (NAD+)
LEVAKQTGGTIITGGRACATAGLERGCYIEPTVVEARPPFDRIAQKEVSGPLKRVQPASPFGDIGRSGYAREMGLEVAYEYTEHKSVGVNVDAKTMRHIDRRDRPAGVASQPAST